MKGDRKEENGEEQVTGMRADGTQKRKEREIKGREAQKGKKENVERDEKGGDGKRMEGMRERKR